MIHCPRCKIPLCRVEIDGVPVHECPDCGGQLVEEMRLKGLERRADPTWTEEQKDELCRQADQANDVRPVTCPNCHRGMRKSLFRNYAHLQVDQCPGCRAYWLDRAELDKVRILFQDSQIRYSRKKE